jgi:tyrosyl-tRNA synthetase
MSTPSTDLAKIEWFLHHAVERVLPDTETLKNLLLSGKRLRVYVGVDPTGPSIHIGHAIGIQKLAELQELGHEIVLLMGDFTAMIGDPTDKSAARKRLTREQVLENLKGYKDQLSKILKFDGPNPAQIRFNSEWLGAMSFGDVVELASHFTVQQMSERDMFEKRLEEGKPVYLHEFLYPLMQGYDSVALEVDLEIGGNDQTFNMLAGRTLLREMKGREKFVLATKLLADPSGKKMGKTEGNMIALTDAPEDAYGKIMSWTDTMILPGYEMLTQTSQSERDDIQAKIAAGENPMVYKKQLAHRVVAWCFGEDAADRAAEHFASVHQQGELPEEIVEFSRASGDVALLDLLVETGLAPSKSEARRQVEQNGVKVQGETMSDVKAMVSVTKEGILLQKGKRSFVKVIGL